jgi:hypothetical protein
MTERYAHLAPEHLSDEMRRVERWHAGGKNAPRRSQAGKDKAAKSQDPRPRGKKKNPTKDSNAATERPAEEPGAGEKPGEAPREAPVEVSAPAISLALSVALAEVASPEHPPENSHPDRDEKWHQEGTTEPTQKDRSERRLRKSFSDLLLPATAPPQGGTGGVNWSG